MDGTLIDTILRTLRLGKQRLTDLIFRFVRSGYTA